MKHLRETFTDEEFEALKHTKENTTFNWHDFIMFHCVHDYWQQHRVITANATLKTAKSKVL